jgi:bifunctional non-homologous end joining protein LigD
MLHGRRGIDVMLLIFDVLVVEGRDVTRRPYWERRLILEELDLEGDAWATPKTHADGEALWDAVCQRGLEGVVAKKRSGHYKPGRRDWLKIKNRAYWRYPQEVEAAKQFHKLRT